MIHLQRAEKLGHPRLNRFIALLLLAARILDDLRARDVCYVVLDPLFQAVVQVLAL